MKLFESTPFCLAWSFVFILTAWAPVMYWNAKAHQSRRETEQILDQQIAILNGFGGTGSMTIIEEHDTPPKGLRHE